MLIRGLGWPAAETQRPGPLGQCDPPDASGVLAGPGLCSAEEELKAQLLALQVVSRARLCLCPAAAAHPVRHACNWAIMLLFAQQCCCLPNNAVVCPIMLLFAQ